MNTIKTAITFLMGGLITITINLLDYTSKVFIFMCVLFLFISIFVFNLQIQNFNTKGNLVGTQSIVQVDMLKDNLHAYFYEQ